MTMKPKVKRKTANENMMRLPGIGRLPKGVVLAVIYLICALIAAGIILHHNPQADPQTEALKRNCACVLLALFAVMSTVWYDKLMVLPVELFTSRRLIFRLAHNDFKKRYAGSYMGVVWAFVQPIVTVVMYWLIFDVISTAREALMGGSKIPYVIFLTTGIAPWFFFTEALNTGTNALIEYNYLVKKVVFKISILPLIKVMSAFYVHVFFTMLAIGLATMYGFYPSVMLLQLPYYMICVFILSLAICYTTCAINVFFRDLAQIISIILQLMQWATPILWNLDMISDKYKAIVKLNPMVYVVNGYRESICGGSWFFDHFYSSTYFWLITIALFGIGSLIFKRTKVHFADVL